MARWCGASGLIVALVLNVSAVYGAIIHVPGEQPSIQAGIDAAVAGDSVVVACGSYYEHDIVMKSGVCLTSESGSADCVTIDGQQLDSVIQCTEVDDAASIIGFTITGGYHSGIRLYTSELLIAHCDIIGNSAVTFGGGISINQAGPIPTTPTIEHCRILDNYAVDGGGVYCGGGSPELSYCLIAGNEAQIWGGGMQISSAWRSPSVSHCTVVDNTSSSWGGGIFSSGLCQFVLQNTIIASNDGDGGIYISGGLAYQSIECCDVYGNVGGNYSGDLGDLTGVDGNISEDPLFCDVSARDFTLDAASPCAPEHSGNCGLIGAWPVVCGTVSIDPPGIRPVRPRLSIHPNPVVSTAQFTVSAGTHARLEIYDPTGRLVGKLDPAGEVSWHPSHSAPRGVYFARLRGEGVSETVKFVVVR